MTTTTHNAAAEILSQLGGSRRLSIMIGAKNFGSANDCKTLTFSFAASKVANHIKITLNGLDLYDVEFIKVGRRNRTTFETPITTVKSVENVYADDLKELFERTTGLFLSL